MGATRPKFRRLIAWMRDPVIDRWVDVLLVSLRASWIVWPISQYARWQGRYSINSSLTDSLILAIAWLLIRWFGGFTHRQFNDWFVYWAITSLMDWATDCLVWWFMDRVIDWFSDWMIARPIQSLMDCWVGRLVHRWIHWIPHWWMHWWVPWLSDSLTHWMGDWAIYASFGGLRDWWMDSWIAGLPGRSIGGLRDLPIQRLMDLMRCG